MRSALTPGHAPSAGTATCCRTGAACPAPRAAPTAAGGCRRATPAKAFTCWTRRRSAACRSDGGRGAALRALHSAAPAVGADVPGPCAVASPASCACRSRIDATPNERRPANAALPLTLRPSRAHSSLLRTCSTLALSTCSACCEHAAHISSFPHNSFDSILAFICRPDHPSTCEPQHVILSAWAANQHEEAAVWSEC